MDLQSDIQYLKYVGEKRAAQLKRLGVETIGDLFYFFPRAYEDWSQIVRIAEAPFGERCCIKAIVDHTPLETRIRKGLTLYKTVVTDGESIVTVTFFNNPYVAQKLLPGGEYLFFGKFTGTLFQRELNSPDVVPAQGGDRIRPIYPQTAGINTRTLEKLVATAFELYGDLPEEMLPAAVREAYHLPGLTDALRELHFPTSAAALADARRRMAFEELFVLQIGLRRLRTRHREHTEFRIWQDHTAAFYRDLPFTPTNAQQRAVKEALADMATDTPMNRLLQGDVGSGKTAVAAALIDTVCKNGGQCALMAPTEILATQHYQTLTRLLDRRDLHIDLLTGGLSAAEKKRVKARLASGETDLIIGTHALLYQDTVFHNLAFVITDEQHRFGVQQRSVLRQKGQCPHVLVMSATPIPRTLALVVYGDLDISVLDELPPGRQKISTFAIDSSKRERAFQYVKQHLDRGKQGYIVCPLVEEDENDAIASAVSYMETLTSSTFRNYRLGLLHGRMKPAEKEETMARFADGTTQLLIATTVIEVGVDVPNAVIMVIENAERFGLSQLHQLRGRIGRGQDASTCILISDAANETAKQRLRIMTETCDGFRIAEEDLRLRGPGDFFGARQHGLPKLKVADMIGDTETVRQAARAVAEIAAGTLPLLPEERPPLSRAVRRLFASADDARD